MNAKNKIDVVAKLSPEMKKVVDVQLASAPAEPATTNEQMRQNYEIERKFWNEGGPVMQTRATASPTPSMTSVSKSTATCCA